MNSTAVGGKSEQKVGSRRRYPADSLWQQQWLGFPRATTKGACSAGKFVDCHPAAVLTRRAPVLTPTIAPATFATVAAAGSHLRGAPSKTSDNSRSRLSITPRHPRPRAPSLTPRHTPHAPGTRSKRMDLNDVTAKAAANVSEAGQKHLYPPPADLAANAHVKSLDEYKAMYDQSINDPETFFGDMARQFHWEKPFDSVGPIYNFDMSKGPIKIDWFQGGTTNICYNALDRHVAAGAGDSVAILWEGNSPDEQASYTYHDVLDEVKKFANVLKSKGVKKGDTVTLYMPMVVELAFACLACARIGAVHSVVFGGFSPEAIRGRMADAQSKVVVTCDAVMRGAKPVQLKTQIDAALEVSFYHPTQTQIPNHRPNGNY